MLTVDRVMARNPDGSLAGPIAGIEQLQFRDALNGPGGWLMTLDTTHPAAGLMGSPGAGIVVLDSNGVVVFSGPVLPSGARSAGVRTITAERTTLQVQGVSDLTCLWWRQIVPPQGRSHETIRGAFGVAAAGMVSRQIRLPGWGAVPNSVGTEVTLTGRYASLGDVVCAEATSQGLHARARWSSGQILFEVVELEATALPVSIEAGSAVSIVCTSTADTSTLVRALGQGEGADRVVEAADVSDGDGWRQIELTLDRRDLSVRADVAVAAAAGLVVGGNSYSVQMVSGVPVPRVGQTAAVSIDGAWVTLPVVESTTTVTPERERTIPVFGAPDRSALTRAVTQTASIAVYA